MEFKLQWTNTNTVPTVINVYRSTSKIEFSKLPEPIATLSNGETEWVDTTALYGVTYYYLLTVTANGQTMPTVNKTFKAVNRRGIGSETVIWGDDRFGYMGQVSYDETMNMTDLYARLILITGINYNGRPTLHKWIRNGKIFYTTTSFLQTINVAVTWDALYQAGMVYGSDDEGPADRRGANPPVVQDAGMIHLGDRYRVRLPRGYSDEKDLRYPDFSLLNPSASHDDLADTPLDEFSDVGYMFQPFFPEKMRYMKYLPTSTSNYIARTLTGVWDGRGIMCQERDKGTDGKVLIRGMNIPSGSVTVSHVTIMRAITGSDYGVWSPIIELVEE